NENTILLATNDVGVLRTTDYGENWTIQNAGFDITTAVYTGFYFDAIKGYIVRDLEKILHYSDDEGETWSANLGQGTIQRLVEHDDKIYGYNISFGSFYQTIDDLSQWTLLSQDIFGQGVNP